MTKSCLSIRDVRKDYEGLPLLKGIDLDLAEDEILCLLGPSGSGKSTLLRIVAGLESQEEGTVLWGGKDISVIPVEKRNFGFMFQDYALFPHMSVAENIAFGPRMHGWANEKIEERISQTLAVVKMEGFRNRSVVDLSGGEKQRVALARTIALNPDLLMLDEPLGALDKALRDELGQELREILKKLQIPTIYVTHDQEEAFLIGDNVAVLNFGRILQKGNPEDIYTSPNSLWLAGFLGFSNQISGKVMELNPVKVSTPLGYFTLAEQMKDQFEAGCDVILVIKPDVAQVVKDKEKNENTISGVVKDSQFMGDGFRLVLEVEDERIFTFRDSHRREIGLHMIVQVDPPSLLGYRVDE